VCVVCACVVCVRVYVYVWCVCVCMCGVCVVCAWCVRVCVVCVRVYVCVVCVRVYVCGVCVCMCAYQLFTLNFPNGNLAAIETELFDIHFLWPVCKCFRRSGILGI
jgi:hypothetical protein